MPEFNDPTTTLTHLEKGDKLMGGTPSEFANILAENVFSRSLTYVQLQALVTTSELIPMMWYKITNATSASFNLYVQAIAVNQIGCDAKDPLYVNDVVKYNFASNIITWRWDTISDISAGEDFRNSNNIQIGENCTHIQIGEESSVTLGSGCSNIIIGNNSTITLPTNSENVLVGNSSGYTNSNTSALANFKLESGAIVTADGSMNGKEVKYGFDITGSGNKSVVYANSGILLKDATDNILFVYYDNLLQVISNIGSI